MKKQLLILVVVFSISLITLGQQKITGFGKLQLGMLITDIPQLNNSTIVSNSSEYLEKVYQNRSTDSYELIVDSSDLYCDFGSFDKRVRCFQIGEYPINENIKLENVRLKFFKNKLFEIIVDGNEVDEMLTTKYGKPKIDYKEKTNTFVNGYGNKFLKKDETWTNTYKTNVLNYSCEYLFLIWYNSKGEKMSLQYTTLTDNNYNKEIEKEVLLVKKRILKREEDLKKKSLEGF